MSIRKKTISTIVSILFINTILLILYYNFFLVKKIDKEIINLNNEYQTNLNKISASIEDKNYKDVYNSLDELSTNYDAFITLYDRNNSIVYTNNKNYKTIYQISKLVTIDNEEYMLTYSSNSDTKVSSVRVVRDLLFFQGILWIVVTIIGLIFANSELLSPILKLQTDMKNYKYGILPKRRKVKTNLDMLQHTFAGVVEDLENEKSKQSRIIASISHDIKTPLTSIMGYAGLLKSDKLNDNTKKEYINKIYNKSIVMKELVEEFDDYLSCNIKGTLRMEEVYVKDLLEELKKDYLDELKEKNIKLVIKSSSSNSKILIDKAKIKRVFSNIITNSIKQNTDNNLVITIYALNKGDEVLFTISDNGKGVDCSELEKIFEPLYTTDPSRKIPGLGLSICKEIIELHNGKIYAKNNNNGLDICFTLKRGNYD